MITQEEKRLIRMGIHDLVETECRGCPFVSVITEQESYCRQKCQVAYRLKGLSRQLLQDEIDGGPYGSHVNRVYGDWTEDEDFYLVNHIPYFDEFHLSKRLNRAPGSIMRRLNMLGKGVIVS
ncbi:zinc-finger domain-containing protein [Domibacillus aminovorans]|uniref:hypothetical protein n=1 Tax=Domibacillus aminovorans TaxID=29332 RepID=UPI003D1ABF9E